MPFTKGKSGNSKGRPKGSGGGQYKSKLLELWWKVFEETDGEKLLRKLAEEDFVEFLKLGIRLMPKEDHVDVYYNRFADWTDEELENFIATGEYPDNED